MAEPLWSILVCTYKRPTLLGELLQSLSGELAVPRSPVVEIVVVDNDEAMSAKAVAERWKDEGLPLRYVVERTPGISAARNRAVASARGDLLLFLDDDQMLPLGTLAKLKHEWADLDGTADALCLRKVIRVEGELSPWTSNMALVGETTGLHLGPLKRTAMGTGGLLVTRALARAVPFDLTLGKTGGEDVDFYLRGRAEGFRFLYCDRPFVWERLPPERATLSYALKTAKRKGAVDVRLALRDAGRLDWLRLLGISAGYLALSLLLLVSGTMGGRGTLGMGLALVWRQLGKLQALFDVDRAHYERKPGARGVLFLTGGGQEGGAERLLEQISAHWSSDQGEASFYFYDWKGDLSFIRTIEARGFKVHRHQKRPGIDLGLWRDLSAVIASRGVSVVHTQDIGAMFHGAAMKVRHPGVRLIHTEHTLHYWIGAFKYRLLHKFLGALYHRIACVSEFVQDELRAKVGTAARRLTIVPNGVDLARFERKPSVSASRDNGTLRLVSVGRIDDNKNLKRVIEAVGALHAKGLRVSLDHAGIGDDALTRELRAMVSAKGLDAFVRFHGFRADVRPLLNQADVFVSASKVECHPVAVLEAMAVGLPCLLSDIPPHRALADMGNLLFNLEDESLERLILEVDRERERLPVLGLAARQGVVRCFSLEAMLRRYFALYAQV